MGDLASSATATTFRMATVRRSCALLSLAALLLVLDVAATAAANEDGLADINEVSLVQEVEGLSLGNGGAATKTKEAKVKAKIKALAAKSSIKGLAKMSPKQLEAKESGIKKQIRKASKSEKGSKKRHKGKKNEK